MRGRPPVFEPYAGKDPYIFVSYAHKDEEVIDDLEQLSRLGFRVWYDKGILEGKAWRQSIESHIEGCRLFLIFVSTNSLDSDYVLAELETAREIIQRDKGKDDCLTILSVFMAGDIQSSLDYKALRRLQGIDRWQYPPDFKEYYLELVNIIQRIAPDTRTDRFDRDSRNLGLGYLPTMKDILCDDKTSLSNEEQEERRNAWVLEMRNADPPISSYRIDNVFQLTSDATHALHNLGELPLESNDPAKPSNLLSLPLDIAQVYVAPLRLVTGLITRLEQNWPPLVTSYSTLVTRGQMNRLEDLHYYIEFCWLAWGPSVLTTSLLDEGREFMVAQAAFGDEANSLPLIMKRDAWHLMEETLGKGRHSGWPVGLRNVLVVKPGADAFFAAVRDYGLLKDVFSDPRQVALYLPYDDAGFDNGEVEALADAQDAFYSTAYVWLMIEQIDRAEVESGAVAPCTMSPGKVIPFFEHANLATGKGLDFLQHCLARKAIWHVLGCEADPDYREKGYYRFSTALFPGRMAAILEEEVRLLGTDQQDVLKRRFRISNNPGEWRTPVEVVAFADAVADSIRSGCPV